MVIPMIEWYDIILRLSVAMLIGCAIGFERELHYKSTFRWDRPLPCWPL
jgi:uncharacterized membrane protein YhiD involved in acid resistance